MTGNNNNERVFELYRAISDVDDKYVAEMLDDDIAEDIRAANRRKKITMRSSITAAAAVFLLVIGIGILPNMGGLKKSDEAVMNGGRNEAAEQAADKDYQGTAGAEEQMKDEASQRAQEDEVPEGVDGFDGVGDQGLAGENKNKSLVPPQAETEFAEEDAETDGTSEDRYEYDQEHIILTDGRGLTVVRGYIDEEYVGEELIKDGDVTLCSVKGISDKAAAAVYSAETEQYLLAVFDGYKPETLADMAADFGFGDYLSYESGYGMGEDDIKDDKSFRKELLPKLLKSKSRYTEDQDAELNEQMKVDDVYSGYELRLAADKTEFCHISLTIHESGMTTISIWGMDIHWTFTE